MKRGKLRTELWGCPRKAGQKEGARTDREARARAEAAGRPPQSSKAIDAEVRF